MCSATSKFLLQFSSRLGTSEETIRRFLDEAVQGISSQTCQVAFVETSQSLQFVPDVTGLIRV